MSFDLTKTLRTYKWYIIPILVLFCLFAIVRGIWIYEGIIKVKDAVIVDKENRRKVEQEKVLMLQERYADVRADSQKRDLMAQEAIGELRLDIGTLQSSMRSLERANTQLRTDLQALPPEIESASDDEVALSIPPKILETYPQYEGSEVFYIPDLDAFEFNRIAVNAVRLSLDEVLNLRIQIENADGQIVAAQEQFSNFESIIENQNTRIQSWTDQTNAAEALAEGRNVLVLSLEDERDAWVDKSKAQSKQLFFYKWGTRIGITAGIVVGALVATR